MYLSPVLELSVKGDSDTGVCCITCKKNDTKSLLWDRGIYMVISKSIISIGVISLDRDQASSLLYRAPTTSRLLAFFVTGPSLSVGTPSIRTNNGSRERNRPRLLYPRIVDDGESSATRSADSPVPQALRSRRPRSRRARRRNRFPGT